MAIELVQNHVLIPHPADWSTRPKWRRRWRDAVAAGTRGAEDRSGLAERPLIELTWTISPVEHNEWSRLEDRIRAALQSGQAVTPYHGRGTKLAAVASGTIVTLVSNTWPFQAGDFVYLQTRDRWSWAEYEVAEIDSVAGAVLTLTAALSRSYAAGGFAWPLLFGRLSTSDFPALHNRRGSVQVTLTQLEPFPATGFDGTACEVTLDVEEGGGDTFDCYEDAENITSLPEAGTAFDGPWFMGNNPFGYPVGEDFETTYADGFQSVPMAAAAEAFDGPWIIGDHDGQNEIELVAASASPGGVDSNEITIPIPFTGAEFPGHLYVLCLVRRDDIVAGLDGWTLVADQKTPSPTTDHWASVYVRTYLGTPPTHLTIEQGTGGIAYSQAAMLLLRSRSGNAISVQNTAMGQYNASANPGLHPIQSLVASGNGCYGVMASGCNFSLTSGTTFYEVELPPWTQINPDRATLNRLCVAGRTLQDGENINSVDGTASHGSFTSHFGAEISVIFET